MEQNENEIDLSTAYDLSDLSEEEKTDMLTAAAMACMPVLLHAFISCGIENFIEHEIVNEADGKRYVLTFQTEESFIKRTNISVIPAKHSKKY